LTLFMADGSPFANQGIADVKKKISNMAKDAGPGQWVIGWGFDDTPAEEQRHLNRGDLDELVAKYHQKGLQIAVYSNGDAAIESVIAAIEGAQKAYPQNDMRHMIIHCQTASDDHIQRMVQLGIVPSFFANHVYYWGDRHESLFLGPQRAARIDPLGSSLKAGLRFTLHADTPVTPIPPLFSIYCAVNRITRNGKVLGAEECISPYDALKAYTTDAAFCSFEENLKGSITAGKMADFTVLSENPLKVAPENIKDIQVMETVVGGAPVS
jgi:predicted amidohydrolase YtcJ